MADAEEDTENMPSERRNMPPGIWSLRFPSRCYGKWSDKHIPGAPAGPDEEVHHEKIRIEIHSLVVFSYVLGIGVFDTLSDSIQCLNFAKTLFIQYLIQYCFTQDSIQNNI